MKKTKEPTELELLKEAIQALTEQVKEFKEKQPTVVVVPQVQPVYPRPVPWWEYPYYSNPYQKPYRLGQPFWQVDTRPIPCNAVPANGDQPFTFTTDTYNQNPVASLGSYSAPAMAVSGYVQEIKQLNLLTLSK